jgi:hypothetical protein
MKSASPWLAYGATFAQIARAFTFQFPAVGAVS